MSSQSIDLRKISDDSLFQEVKRRFECSFRPVGHVVLMGPPASGKGTQSPRLRDFNCWCHISTGDLLREEVKQGTELGQQAKQIMESGGLVSDDIILEMVRKQLREPECSRGAIFDGFPRTLPQAEGLDRMLSEEGYAIKKAVDFVIDDNLLAERIVNRRVHLPSGRTYNLKSNPPKVEGKDDFTGEDLVQRKDDTLEVFQSRMKSYHEMTKPLISYYSEQGKYEDIDGTQSIETVWDKLRNLLG